MSRIKNSLPEEFSVFDEYPELFDGPEPEMPEPDEPDAADVILMDFDRLLCEAEKDFKMMGRQSELRALAVRLEALAQKMDLPF